MNGSAKTCANFPRLSTLNSQLSTLSASHYHSTIHGQHLAGDVFRLCTCEEGDGARDVVGLAEFAERNLPDHARLERLRQHLGHVRGDEAWRDGVARDATAGELAR